jgi:hypothetical protein
MSTIEGNIAKVGGSFLVFGFALFQLGGTFQQPVLIPFGQKFIGLGLFCLAVYALIYFLRNRAD